MIEPVDNLLMSDSIRGIVPDLTEEILSQIKHRYVTVRLEAHKPDQQVIIAGSLVGISVEDVLKIDAKVKLETGFEVMSSLTLRESYLCKNLVLSLGDFDTHVNDEWDLSSAKVYDIDHESMLCTLGLDLTRKTDNYNTVHHGKTDQD